MEKSSDDLKLAADEVRRHADAVIDEIKKEAARDIAAITEERRLLEESSARAEEERKRSVRNENTMRIQRDAIKEQVAALKESVDVAQAATRDAREAGHNALRECQQQEAANRSELLRDINSKEQAHHREMCQWQEERANYIDRVSKLESQVECGNESWNEQRVRNGMQSASSWSWRIPRENSQGQMPLTPR